MLVLKCPNNKEQTLKRLTTCIKEKESKGDICIKTIYKTLTYTDCTEYNNIDIKTDGFVSQNNMNYESGAYFICHKSKKESYEERMIINLRSQEDSLKIANSLKESDITLSVKFLACSKKDPFTRNKCDKVVIYYNKINREKEYETILNSGVNADKFLNDFSAFYDIYANDTGKIIYVGIAPETNPNKSFSYQNAECIAEGIKKGIKDAKELFNYWKNKHAG